MTGETLNVATDPDVWEYEGPVSITFAFDGKKWDMVKGMIFACLKDDGFLISQENGVDVVTHPHKKINGRGGNEATRGIFIHEDVDQAGLVSQQGHRYPKNSGIHYNNIEKVTTGDGKVLWAKPV
jgi:hypothetical protein